jgi:formamidopyrimidine-DNA glycosylase
MLMHFGMTGRLRYFRDMDNDPPHDRFLISFEAGYHLALDDGRMFGKVDLVEDPTSSSGRRSWVPTPWPLTPLPSGNASKGGGAA